MLLNLTTPATIIVILEIFLVLDNVLLALHVKRKVPRIAFIIVAIFWAVCLGINMWLYIL